MRLISGDGEQLGVMNTREALETAREQGLDLVEVSAQADPPVCRIADHGKLLYAAAKRMRKAKAGQKANELKEIRFRPNIDDHDLAAKVRKIREFIGQGSKVKLTVRFRGREIGRQQTGLELLKRVATELKDEARLEGQPQSQGNRAISLTLIPAKREQA